MRIPTPPLTPAAIASVATFVMAGNPARADPFPASVSVTTLDGANGFRLTGVVNNDSAGWSVSSAGDVNGDGVDDAVIGAPGVDPNGVNGAGAVYVVFGRNTAGPAGPYPATMSLSALDGLNGFRIEGATQSGVFGNAVTGVGDLNGDGIGDIAGASPTAAPDGVFQAGSVFVIFGRNTAVAGAFPATFSVATLDGSNGFRINSAGIAERAGSSMAGAGDINDDGIDDLIIGAPSASPSVPNGTGRAHVVYGKNTAVAGQFPPVLSLTLLNGANGFRLVGVGATEECGYAVAGGGDINHDGVDDVLVGARSGDRNMLGNSGVTYVVYGRHGSNFAADTSLASLDGSLGFRIDGDAELMDSGSAVAFVADVNGDAIDDIAIGAPGARPGGMTSAGSTFVFFGKNTAMSGDFPAVLSLATLDGATGFRLNGAVAQEQSSSSLSGADVNNDGLGDVLVGALASNPPGASLGGAIYTIYGRDTVTRGAPFPPVISLGSVDGTIGFRLDGAAGEKIGFSLSRAGDINADGVADFITGGTGITAGRVYTVFGRGAAPPPCAGDTNGDNAVDFLDLNNVLSAFGAALGQPAYIPGADLNDDDVVDFLDLNIVLSFFGTAC